MESGFQVYITGTHVPMREMYATMTPGVEYLSLSNLGPLSGIFRRTKRYVFRSKFCKKTYYGRKGKMHLESAEKLQVY